ncbi:CRISPR-associated protein Csx15 [Thermopirellula anaerolimosa]
MFVLNFAHPLTDSQLDRIAELAGGKVDRVVSVPLQFDHARPFDEQVREVLAGIPLTSQEWQTMPIVINLPSLAVIAAVLLAEIHGRAGYFPTILRLRPVAGSVPPQFEVAELVNLQAVRDAARACRG